MLDELAVHNLGVIESARVEPSPGLTVITGETGTGKTLLLGALRLLLGGVARSDLIGPFGDEASAEGRFVRPDGVEIGAGRRLPRDGRSRAYLNGSIASAKALEDQLAGLVDVVAQHDHISITRPGEARNLVDRALDEQGVRALEDYRRSWSDYNGALEARDQLGGDLASLSRELDLVRFQSEEIGAAGFHPGEDEELEAAASRMRNIDEIADALALSLQAIETAREAGGDAVSALRKAVRLDQSLATPSENLAAVADSMGDVSHELRTYAEALERDPAQLEQIESRLTLLGDLRRKYGPGIPDILEFGRQASRRRDELEALMGRAESIEQEVEEAGRALAEAGGRLLEARRRGAEKIASIASGHLRDLGFTDPLIDLVVEPASPGAGGADTVGILFASDSRLTPGPISSVASGGELSRLVLALRLAGGGGQAESLVFDEVDAGIGGMTALALGHKLADLARDRQVLCVTHLPQLAAFADRHYVVRRSENTAVVVRVDGDERLQELTRMLAGLPESERGREAAEELLELATTG